MSQSSPLYTMQDRFLDQAYSLAGRHIDPVSGSLVWQGERKHLRRKELEVLALLASADGKQVSRENFIAVVWQGNDLVGERGLTNTIVFLRRSLHDKNKDQPLIRTIPRRGYQLAVPVLQSPEQDSRSTDVGLEPGDVVPESPGWRLVRRIASSQDGDSWLAEPSEFGEPEQERRVFRFCSSEAHLRRLRREVTLLRYLTQNLSDRSDIALIRDWQLDEPPYYLARDHASFGTLRDWIKAGELPHDPENRRSLMIELAEALAAVHALGVMHRRLNADTILVDQGEDGPHLKLSTFDLGVLDDRSNLVPFKITAAGLTLGADETEGAPEPADDVYAMGIVLLQLALRSVDVRPDAECLTRVDDAELRNLLGRCFGPAEARPPSSDIASTLAGVGTPEGETTLGADISTNPPVGEDRAARSTNAKIPRAPDLANLPLRIGNYRLLDKLGTGGMGSVYLAEQRQPYRQVALKVVRSGLDGKEILARFEAERQALALINHPNVTSVLDSGLAADGRFSPWST